VVIDVTLLCPITVPFKNPPGLQKRLIKHNGRIWPNVVQYTFITPD